MNNEIFDLSGANLILVAIMGVLAVVLIIVTILEILRSDFKPRYLKFLFMVIVLIAPFLGTIIYLIFRNGYRVSTNSRKDA